MGDRRMDRRQVMRALRGALVATGLLLAGTGAQAAEGGKVTVFAAASLKNVMDEAAAAYQAESGTVTTASYAASSALAKQIEQGAPADLFFSADLDWMKYLTERHLIAEGTETSLLVNELVLIVPADAGKAPATIDEKFDLKGLIGDGRLAVGQVDSVPAGRYTKAALTHLGMWDMAQPKLAQVDNVRAALALVARGEAPAGIVYATDAKVEPKVAVLGTFPETSHPPIIYPVALTVDGAKNEAAKGLLGWLKGPKAKAIFEKAGFTIKADAAS